MKAVVLAAGRGTRMLPLTARRPKALIPVLNRPLIEYVILGLREAGASEFAVVTGHMGEAIRAALRNGERFGVPIRYFEQPQPQGSGAATLLVEDFVGGRPFLLSFCDIVTPMRNYPRVREAYESGRWAAVVSLNWMEDPYEGAAVTVDREGRVLRIVEKPPKGTSRTHFNNAGIFVLPPTIFDGIRATGESPRGERELTSAIEWLIEQGEPVGSVELEGYRSDVARPSEILALSHDIWADGGLPNLLVGEGSEIDRLARITPPVCIGKGCRIGAANVGPYVSIADGSWIAEGATLRNVALLGSAGVREGCWLEYVVADSGVTIRAGQRLIGTAAQPIVVWDGEAS